MEISHTFLTEQQLIMLLVVIVLNVSIVSFSSEESTLKWFSNLIDDEISSVGEFFASRFLPNHFLSPHHDHEKGKIATVLNLSKIWKPEWGGCLHFMDSDYKNVTKMFNRHLIN